MGFIEPPKVDGYGPEVKANSDTLISVCIVMSLVGTVSVRRDKESTCKAMSMALQVISCNYN